MLTNDINAKKNLLPDGIRISNTNISKTYKAVIDSENEGTNTVMWFRGPISYFYPISFVY